MADWVEFTRLDTAHAQPINIDASVGPSMSYAGPDIDNCCYLDRYCTSDEEWERASWPFRTICVMPIKAFLAATAVDLHLRF